MKTIVKLLVLSCLVSSVGFSHGAAPAKGVNPFAAYQAAKANGTYVPKAKASHAKGHAAPRAKLNTSGHLHAKAAAKPAAIPTS